MQTPLQFYEWLSKIEANDIFADELDDGLFVSLYSNTNIWKPKCQHGDAPVSYSDITCVTKRLFCGKY